MRKVYGTLVALMVLAGCGFNSGPSFEIGLKRVAVNLSFKDQTKALPPLRKTIFIPAPAPEIGSFVTQVVPNLFPTSNPTPTPQFPKIAPACPTAPPNSHPVLPATVFVYSAPTPGVYTAHNTGTFSISSGALSVKAAYPPQSSFTVGPSTTSTDNSNPASGPTTVIQYTITQSGADGSTTATTYRTLYSPSPIVGTVENKLSQGNPPQGELDLVKLVTTSSTGTSTFTPTPPVELMAFKTGQGTNWTSAGIDQKNNTAMQVQGKTLRRAVIDLCGTVYDTYEIQSSETITNLSTGFVSKTNPVNVYDVATQYGGLFIHEHISTTTNYKSGTGAVGITQDYDRTLNTINPVGGTAKGNENS